MNFTTLLKTPSALIPLVMSIAAFMLIVAVISTVGITHQQDEGVPARIFQLLIVIQVPIITFFGFKWLPKSPRSSLLVLFLQIGAAVAAIATIALIESSVAM